LPGAAVPATLGWGAAGFAIVALGWVDVTINPTAAPLLAEHGLIVFVAAASVLLGGLAAILHDDLEHVLGYSIVQDAGLALLTFGVVRPDVAQAGRDWLIGMVAVKSGLAAWVLVTRSAFGVRRLSELAAGPARRRSSPSPSSSSARGRARGWPRSRPGRPHRSCGRLAVRSLRARRRVRADRLPRPDPRRRAGPDVGRRSRADGVRRGCGGIRPARWTAVIRSWPGPRRPRSGRTASRSPPARRSSSRSSASPSPRPGWAMPRLTSRSAGAG
jgi:hypothetical protein